jgi:hypothetical protein
VTMSEQKRYETGSRDEIEKIMNEIEELQHEMGAVSDPGNDSGMEEKLVSLKRHELPAEAATDGTLMMTLHGKMTLRLKYEIEGQEVTIGFGDNALRVQLSDGAEFKIPVGKRSVRNAA